jgi:hypothetical protein
LLPLPSRWTCELAAVVERWAALLPVLPLGSPAQSPAQSLFFLGLRGDGACRRQQQRADGRAGHSGCNKLSH